jgi:hypothetical protein
MPRRLILFAIVLVPLLSIAMVAGAQGCAVCGALWDALVHNSGAPPKAERQRLEARKDSTARALPTHRLVVLPVTVLARGNPADTVAARAIAGELARRGLGAPTVAPRGDSLPFRAQPNEARIFWDRFLALAAHERAHPRPDADYVLQVDVFGAPERGSIGAVHAMMVAHDGTLAYSGFWNSHQPLYKEMRPTTLDDVARMVATDLERHAAARPPR